MSTDKCSGYSSGARLAQSVERKALNLVVVGLSPTVGVSFPQLAALPDSKEDETPPSSGTTHSSLEGPAQARSCASFSKASAGKTSPPSSVGRAQGS